MTKHSHARLATTLFAALGLALVHDAARAASDAPPLPDTFLARVEALASMQTLNAELLASRSATITLETWCATHALADNPRIVAVRAPDEVKAPTDAQRQRLQVGPDEPVAFRHVRLLCGRHVLSEADNWYVPSRLTPEMNRLLETTDIPFGKVVAPLEPTRQTFAAAVLWAALPLGWERRPPLPDRPGPLELPPVLFEHHAILFDATRQPFCEVDERYSREVLAFGSP